MLSQRIYAFTIHPIASPRRRYVRYLSQKKKTGNPPLSTLKFTPPKRSRVGTLQIALTPGTRPVTGSYRMCRSLAAILSDV